MTIRRGARPNSGFYTLDKRISEDKRLSWAARGMLVFLLGKPDHWTVSIAHLANETQDAIGRKSGRDAIYGLINELKLAGYIAATRDRGENGQLGGITYVVQEVPDLLQSLSDQPITAEPVTASPVLARTTLVNTDLKQELNSKQELKNAPAALASVEDLAAGGFDPELAQEFLSYRKQNKTPFTVRAWDSHRREAQEAGLTNAAAAIVVMENGWKGFRAKYVCDEKKGYESPYARQMRQKYEQVCPVIAAADPNAPPAQKRINPMEELNAITHARRRP